MHHGPHIYVISFSFFGKSAARLLLTFGCSSATASFFMCMRTRINHMLNIYNWVDRDYILHLLGFVKLKLRNPTLN